LTNVGLIVEQAEDGSVAVDMLLKNPVGYYALVLMDIQMPIMDGYTTTKTIRNFKDTTLANIPIVAMTANAFEEDRQKAMSVGMNAHIAKPISVEELLNTLESVIDSSKK
jgi:CheY-like chemotaxis protein